MLAKNLPIKSDVSVLHFFASWSPGASGKNRCVMKYREYLRSFQFARALRSRSFALLWMGQTISVLGDAAFYPALAWQVLILTDSGTAMGIVAIAQMIPTLAFLLIGGTLADRVSRRLILLWSDGGRAVVVLLIAGPGWFHLLQFWHLVALAFLFGIVDSFFFPTMQAIPPQLVEKEQLTSSASVSLPLVRGSPGVYRASRKRIGSPV
jgi:MFS family permease